MEWIALAILLTATPLLTIALRRMQTRQHSARLQLGVYHYADLAAKFARYRKLDLLLTVFLAFPLLTMGAALALVVFHTLVGLQTADRYDVVHEVYYGSLWFVLPSIGIGLCLAVWPLWITWRIIMGHKLGEWLVYIRNRRTLSFGIDDVLSVGKQWLWLAIIAELMLIPGFSSYVLATPDQLVISPPFSLLPYEYPLADIRTIKSTIESDAGGQKSVLAYTIGFQDGSHWEWKKSGTLLRPWKSQEQDTLLRYISQQSHVPIE